MLSRVVIADAWWAIRRGVASKKLDYGLLVVMGKSVSLRSDKEVSICCGRSGQIVEFFHVIKRLPQAATIKKIIVLA